jgi:hypothetical protein
MHSSLAMAGSDADGNSGIATGLAREMIVDLVVPRHGGAPVRCNTTPLRAAGTFAQQLAPVRRDVARESTALHTAIGSSSYPFPAASG